MLNQLFIYDEIYWGYASEFSKRFAEAQKIGEITCRVNTVGGSIIDGMGVSALIKSSEVPVNIIVDGVCASIGTYFLCAGKTRKMRKSALLMMHSASGVCFGTAKDMRNEADVIEMFENLLATAYSERTGKTKEEIIATYFDGNDHWLTADEALAIGMVDEIVEDDKIINVVGGDWNAIYKQVLTNKIEINMKKPLWLARLGYKENDAEPAETEVDEKIEHLQNSLSTQQEENKVLAGKVAAFELEEKNRKEAAAAARTAEIETIVSNALKEGKFKAELKATYTAMLTADFENGKAVIDSLQAGKSLTEQTPTDKKVEARKDWTYKDYMKKAPADLNAMKTNDPDGYKALFVAQYGKEPKIN